MTNLFAGRKNSWKESRILLVDDDPVVRELLEVNLISAGYRTVSVKSGREAIRRLRRVKPDLVILDIMMPEVDGWEVCKFVRDNPELQAIKILMLTARDSDKDRMIGKDIFKADEYVTKPFDMKELLKSVSGLLEGNHG
jgi:two-component system alkaline phosphatase synthesis response regulator PhoP